MTAFRLFESLVATRSLKTVGHTKAEVILRDINGIVRSDFSIVVIFFQEPISREFAKSRVLKNLGLVSVYFA